nr:Cof-type HAD-IIB family hydrolase [Enterococcus sp. DIV2402]MBO0463910.1 HAD family hydrolase [Enterococcus sp. DIV2402]
MIKAIAVDMDGTFLDTTSRYDVQRFERIYHQLCKKQIKFIVASGNQYYQLKSFFPGKDAEIVYVAENGAIIGENQNLQSVSQFSSTFVQTLLSVLLTNDYTLEFIVCGVKSAYLLSSASQQFKEFAKKYYYQLTEVSSFNTLPDDVFVKIALDVEVEKTNSVVKQLNVQFDGQLVAVASGHGSIDIIIPDITKGSTIAKLLKKWQIMPDELLAFGDANNDLEMLGLTKHSYAMEQSSPQVKRTATYQAPSNNNSGVLAVIETYLD